jgi:protein-tyrosine phosphatase/nicotinamidase-related amidase
MTPTVTVLVTQCLQRDFVEPGLAHAPLPNVLHVGRTEARRLLGHDPARGPLAQLMTFARSPGAGALEIIHIRDWHDPTDAAQAAHLSQFGAHCVADTPGARLVLDLEAGAAGRPTEHFVEATGLNDFEGTSLAATLAAIQARHGGARLRVGVIGVWTEAKVTFLLYDLKTRLGIDALATCSALTASASRAAHFAALEQLRRVLGVEVFDGVGDFADWLAPGATEHIRPPDFHTTLPVIEWRDAPLPLSDRDLSLLGHLYRDAARLRLSPLGGGFSGATVLRVRAWDALGHALAPSVAKLGPRAQIAAERVAFERVEDILGNSAPAVRDFVDIGDRAGIEYAFASMGDGDVRTLKGLYAAGEDPLPVLTRAFDEVLGRFHTVVTYEVLPLLTYYGFESRFAPGVRARAESLFGPMGDTVELAPGYTAPHVARFYETLDENPPQPGESHFVAYVHGDLNGANVLVDARDNVWLIDFFHAHRGHVIKDLVKLENDLLYLFTPLEDDAELAEAIAMSRALRRVDDLAAPLPEAAPEGVSAPALVRAWRVLRWLRARMARLVQSDRDPAQLSLALLRYAVHTLSFDEASHRQKRWAFAAACGHAEDYAAARREEQALRVDWLAEPAGLGLTLCPGRTDRGRDLDADLSALKSMGVTDLVCLLNAGELDRAGVPDLIARAAAAGLAVLQRPIPDQGVPTPAEARALVEHIDARLAAGGRVVVHCMGGLGRSGLVAGCVVRARGLTGVDAIAAVRAVRGPRAIETPVQAAFVAAHASG